MRERMRQWTTATTTTTTTTTIATTTTTKNKTKTYPASVFRRMIWGFLIDESCESFIRIVRRPIAQTTEFEILSAPVESQVQFVAIWNKKILHFFNNKQKNVNERMISACLLPKFYKVFFPFYFKSFLENFTFLYTFHPSPCVLNKLII